MMREGPGWCNATLARRRCGAVPRAPDAGARGAQQLNESCVEGSDEVALQGAQEPGEHDALCRVLDYQALLLLVPPEELEQDERLVGVEGDGKRRVERRRFHGVPIMKVVAS